METADVGGYCHTCNRRYGSDKGLEKHHRDFPTHRLWGFSDSSPILYHSPPRCRPCDKGFVSEQALEHHMRDSPAHRSLNCELCGEECNGTAALEEHTSFYHTLPPFCQLTPTPFCRQCKWEFFSLTSLRQHLQDSPRHKVFECPKCGQECFGKAGLDAHTKSCSPLSCEQCDRRFGSEADLQQHSNDAHKSPAFSFGQSTSQAALGQHPNSPAVHRHRCEKCKRNFGSAAALQHHRASPKHAYECATCGRSFASDVSLKHHLHNRGHSRVPPTLPPSTLPRTPSSINSGRVDANQIQGHQNDNRLWPPLVSGEDRRSTNEFHDEHVWGDDSTLSFQTELAPTSQTPSQAQLPASEASTSLELGDSGPSDPLSVLLPTLLPRATIVQDGEQEAARQGESTSVGTFDFQTRSTATNEDTVLRSGSATLVPLSAEADEHKTWFLQEERESLRPSAQVAKGSSFEEGGTCCICFDRPKNAALVPCGHRFCFECGEVMYKRRGDCPICNGGIQWVLKLFG